MVGPVLKKLELHRLDYASAVAFLAYSASAVVTPICLLILADDLEFTLTGGGGIEVVRASILVAVMLVSGLVAARWGKVRPLGCGALVIAAGLIVSSAAPSYGIVLVAAAMIGLGCGILEALITPLTRDLHPEDSGRYLNWIHGFWPVGVLTTVLIVGEMLTRGVSWRLIMGCTGLFGVVAASLYLHHVRAEDVPAGSASQAVAHMRSILRIRPFWNYMAAMFFGAGAESAFMFWTASYVQLNYDGLPRAGGIGTAIFAGGMIVGRFGSAHTVEQRHLRRLILASAVTGFGVSLFVPSIESLGGLYALLFFIGLSVACFWPSIQSCTADRFDVDTTILFILLSCAGVSGFALTSWLMGWIGDRAGLDASFRVATGMFAMVIVTMSADRHRP